MKLVIISPEAERDILDIGDYIAEDDPRRALDFMSELERRAMMVGGRPLGYRERREISPGLRAARHGSYLIFFRDLPDQVRIVRIVHGSRDVSAIFAD